MTAFTGLGTLAVALLLIGAAAAGTGFFTVAVTLLAAIALLDLSGLLAGATRRPVVPAAALAGLGLPLVVAADPAVGWERLGLGAALVVLAGFGILLVSPRRRGVTEALGATALSGLLVGLGAAALIVLRAEAEGLRWIVGLAALAAAVDVGGAVAVLLRGRGRGEVAALPADARPGGALTLMASAAAVGVVGLVLALAAVPPFTGRITVVLVLVALGLGTLAAELTRLLRATAGVDPAARLPWRLGDGRVTGVVSTLLLTAPAVALIVRSAA